MKCAKCGTVATKYSKDGIPVCSRHINEKIAAPKCPDCGSMMNVRSGKYGAFWGCTAFPMCQGIEKIR